MSISERIRSARKSLGLSQEEIARRADMSLNGYAAIERGFARDPHYSTLVSIADALGVTVGELLEEPALSGKVEPPHAGVEVRVNRLPVEARRILLDTLDSLEHEFGEYGPPVRELDNT